MRGIEPSRGIALFSARRRMLPRIARSTTKPRDRIELRERRQLLDHRAKPLVVQNAPPDTQIAVLRREGDHVVIDNDPSHVRDWRLDQILTSDLFGLPSARAKRLDALLEEQDRILRQATLSDADERRLAAIEAALDDMPAGEVPAETEAMRVIHDAARAMRSKP